METQLAHLTEEKGKWAENEKTFNRTIAQLRADNETLRSSAPVALLKAIFENIGSFIKQKLHINK